MLTEVLFLSLCFVSSQQQLTSAEEFTPICGLDSDPFGSGSGLDLPVLPNLPNQFSFTIEGNLIERNSTVIATEYYDGPGNRGRLEFSHNDSSSISIFDYNLGEIFLIPDFRTGDGCRVYPVTNHLPRHVSRPFGIENQNGTIHIGSPRTFLERLRENDTTMPQYVGKDMVRGILTHRWQACFNRENNSYLIDYYFANEEWNYGQGQNLDSTQTLMVPVQFILNATRIESGEVRNIYHIYSVVDFRAGPDSVPDSLFRVPNGLACTGRFPGQPVPQIPPFFSTYVQRVDKNVTQTFREFYDLPHKLFRIDVYKRGNRRGVPGPVSIIHDFDTSVQYVISNRIINCSAQHLSQATPFFFDISTNDSMLQLVSPNNFFFLGSEFNYSYEGVSNIRGVDVDSWVSVRDFERITDNINLTDAIYEVFFTRPDWTYATDRSINTDPVPWRIKITGEKSILNSSVNSIIKSKGTYEMDFFDFSTDEPPYDAFDISSCSAPEDFYTMILIIPGQERGIDFGQLRRNIRTSVTNYTGIRPLQIGNIQIVSENGTHIFITFQISNLTRLAKIDPTTNTTAQQAVDFLTSNTTDSQLSFQVQISPNVSVDASLHVAGRGPMPTACNGSSCNCSAPPVDPNSTTSTSNCSSNNKTVTEVNTQSGLSGGAVAGIALCLLILGIIIGVILQLTLREAVRWFRTSGAAVNIGESVKYKKQEESISLN